MAIKYNIFYNSKYEIGQKIGISGWGKDLSCLNFIAFWQTDEGGSVDLKMQVEQR